VGLSVFLLLALAASADAQTPPASSQSPEPVVGFVSPYEVARTLRGAGFDVLAPPLREGTTYVVRATDFRGLLMRVVVDARTGAIRDATRIVPGPGRYGQLYGAPAPYDPADYDNSVPLLGESEMGPPRSRPMAPMPSMVPMPSESSRPARPSMSPIPPLAPASAVARSPAAAHSVPLPRARPAAVALRERAPAVAAQPQSVPTAPAPAAASVNAGSARDNATGAVAPLKPQASTEIITAAPPPSAAVTPNAPGAAAVTAPKKPASVVPPLND
jgi:hypothetical protein